MPRPRRPFLRPLRAERQMHGFGPSPRRVSPSSHGLRYINIFNVPRRRGRLLFMRGYVLSEDEVVHFCREVVHFGKALPAFQPPKRPKMRRIRGRPRRAAPLRRKDSTFRRRKQGLLKSAPPRGRNVNSAAVAALSAKKCERRGVFFALRRIFAAGLCAAPAFLWLTLRP